MPRSGGMWDQDRYQQADIANGDASGYVAGEVDATPATLAEEARADRAAGRQTWGTRGWADTEALDR